MALNNETCFGANTFPFSKPTNRVGQNDRLEDEHWRSLPSILSMRLYEWISALTHPNTGAYPNGISPKELDWLARHQIANAASEVRSELKLLWKSNNHLGVMLWNEVKAGRITRLHKACYVGANVDGLQRKGNEDLTPSVNFADKATESRCVVCKGDLNENGDKAFLKCVECVYQSHLRCAYPDNMVPKNLLKHGHSAISNWRCYDCKRCHLCGGKDDSNDGLLLCDGCDMGEHMGCQRPPLTEVPPAPWFCSLCRPPRELRASPVFDPAATDDQIPRPNAQISSPCVVSSALVIDERVEMDEKPPAKIADVVSFPECPGSQSDADVGRTTQSIIPTSPVWPPCIKATSPPYSDETPEVEKQKTRRSSDASSGSTGPEKKPIRTRLGKREADGKWMVNGEQDPPSRRRKNHQRTLVNISPSSQNSADTTYRTVKRFDHGGTASARRIRKENDESDLLPFMSEDLPLLNEEEVKNVKGAKSWSVNDTVAFLEHMGYNESANAFKREEIDGAALLLLRRQDVLLNLGLKLGPALKTYKFIRYIQSTVRSL